MSESEAPTAEGTEATEATEVDPELLKEMDELDLDFMPEAEVEQKEEPEPEKKEEEVEQKEEESAERQEGEEGSKEKEDEDKGEVVKRDEEVKEEEQREVEQPREEETTETVDAEFLKRQNEELRAMMKDLMSVKKEEEKKEEEKKEEGETQEEVAEVKLDEFDFFEGEDISEDVYDPTNLREVMNKQLNKVYKASVEQSIRRIPDLVQNVIGQVLETRQAVSEFYDQNPDLREYRDDVQKVADMVVNENPNMTVDAMFKETARRFRMYKGMPEPSGRDDTPPTSPKKPKARKGPEREKKEEKKDSRTKAQIELEEEMDELNWE